MLSKVEKGPSALGDPGIGGRPDGRAANSGFSRRAAAGNKTAKEPAPRCRRVNARCAPETRSARIVPMAVPSTTQTAQPFSKSIQTGRGCMNAVARRE